MTQTQRLRQTLLFVMIVSFFLCSCTLEEELPDQSYLSPPSWIWGSWAAELQQEPTYVFTPDNLIHKQYDWNRAINNMNPNNIENTRYELTITEDTSQNRYWLDIDWGAGASFYGGPQNGYYRFKRINANTFSKVEYDPAIQDTATTFYYRQ